MHRVLSLLCSIALLLLSVGPPAYSEDHSHSDSHHVHGSQLGAVSALAHVLGVTSQISQNRSNPAAWTELAHHLVHYRDTQNNANLIAQGKHPPHHTELWTVTGWAHVAALSSQFSKNWKNPTAWTELFHHAMHAASGMDSLLKPSSAMGRFFSNPLFSQLSAVGALGHSIAIISQLGKNKNWKNPAVWTDLFLHLVEVRDFQSLLKPLLGPLADTSILVWMMLSALAIGIPLALASKDQEEDKDSEEPAESVLDAIDLMNRSGTYMKNPALSPILPELASERHSKNTVVSAAPLLVSLAETQPLTGSLSVDASYASFLNAQGIAQKKARQALGSQVIAPFSNKHVTQKHLQRRAQS